ncbi:hypothetical protein AS034_01930 [[Bacillus] enclensis]|uniref:Uncharacterized protein n=1 Tax=[Bacillus] enclensis TaxID=1402860 RepID=A0A0V8HQ55_9BACI|nr:hypothetical protein [[Bacillus] enclensis]KSU64618.1 hypothetical protein AS034_01930 [[Bacillus] enclensis]SCB77171.1 hypothetical protein GA0061094_0400 [[Bacillus] enclensis]
MDIQRFTAYYNKKMKNNLTKTKRLQEISDFFQANSGAKVSFTNEKECYLYIVDYINSREDEAEDILDKLYFKMEYSFSTQNPNYVFDFKNTTQDSVVFFTNFKKLFKKNKMKKSKVRFGEFEFTLLNEIKLDSQQNIVVCDLEYREYTENPISGKEHLKNHGPITVIFDLRNNKFISSKSANYKSHNKLVSYFKSMGYNIQPIYILKRVQTLKKQNTTEFSATTLLIINLLYETIPVLGYNINLESISFTNLDSQNIQGVKLKGTDLLKAPEVLQRIHSSDEVHTVRLFLEFTDKKQNGIEEYFSTTFTIDLKNKLAFIFSEEDISEYRRREICINLQSSLMHLIYAEDTISKGENIIHKELPKPKSLNQTVNEIQKSVLKKVNDEKDRIEIKKYFIETFPVIFSIDS